MNDTKAKPTPEPWEIRREISPDGYSVYKVSEYGTSKIATLYNFQLCEEDGETQEPNARLIAASPIGYELAEAVLAANRGQTGASWRKVKEHAKKFMAAIAGMK